MEYWTNRYLAQIVSWVFITPVSQHSNTPRAYPYTLLTKALLLLVFTLR
jgi:hypothetical protein